jgi:hypothetical protein
VISFFWDATSAGTEWQFKVLEDKQFITDILSYASEHEGVWAILQNASQHPGFFFMFAITDMFLLFVFCSRCKSAHSKCGF